MNHPRWLSCLVIALQCSPFTVLTARAQEGAAEDSLRREILQLAVRDAELDAERTNLWHRLIPRAELSAGFSAGDLLFAGLDATRYVLPKDSYRLSVSLDLHGLFDAGAHEKAIIALSRRRSELSLAAIQNQESRRSTELGEARRDTLRSILGEELGLRMEDMRYHAMLFEQGKASFDDILRSRLALLAARRSLLSSGRSDELLRGRE